MRFLRTASTRRLLAVIAGLVAAVVATAAIAAAASGTGPVPKHQPLASALHQALRGPKVTGITAHITFTNHLIDASALQGSDPILTGASGRLWLADHRLRLELQSNNGDVEVLIDHNRFWISDPAANTVYQGTLPRDMVGSSTGGSNTAGAHKDSGIPSIAQIQKTLTRLMMHVNLSGATPGDVAGQAAYTVSVSPKHDGGLLGSAEIAWDAIRGVPLRLAVYARGNSTPVLELRADDISYGSVPSSDFNIAPPTGAKVVKIATGAAASDVRKARAGHQGHHASVTGISAVASRLSFPLVAPSNLVGLPRHTVTLLDWGGSKAALVTYGRGLGGIAVIEKASSPASSAAKAKSSQSQSQTDPGHGGLSLPTVSINGATGTELDTALGTLVNFARSGVDYTVVGSVPSAAADAAARGL